MILDAPTFGQLFRPVETEKPARIPRPPTKGKRAKTATPATAARPGRKVARASAKDVATARALWDDGKTLAQIAAALTKPYPTIYGWRQRDKWPAQKKSATPAVMVPGVPKRPFV